MTTPVPEWTKQILAPAGKAEATGPASEPEPIEDVLDEAQDERETDVPEDVQDEIRALAAAEAEALADETPPEAAGEEIPEDADPGELEAQAAAEPAEVEAQHDEQEPEEPPKPPRPPRRFEFAFPASGLKAFVAQLEHLVDEAKVHATKGGWHVLAVDPAHVAMVELHLADPIDCFERRNGLLERFEGDVEFGLDVTKMKEALRLARKDDTVRMTVDLPDAEDKDRMTVEVGRTTRTMAAIDTSGIADPRVPPLNLPAKLTVQAEDLLEAVKACEAISDHVRLTATREGLHVLAEGDVDKVSMDFRHGEQAEIEYVQGEEGKATSLFPLDYLSAFLKAVKAERLVVQLGTDYPVRVDWDGVTKGTWLLAPRIETSD